MIENGWQDLVGSDRPTEEFLAQLLEYARWYGWRGDVSEVFDFIDALRLEAGKKALTNKEMELFPYDDPPDLDELTDEDVDVEAEEDEN